MDIFLQCKGPEYKKMHILHGKGGNSSDFRGKMCTAIPYILYKLILLERT